MRLLLGQGQQCALKTAVFKGKKGFAIFNGIRNSANPFSSLEMWPNS
jgi:hypothetical protein